MAFEKEKPASTLLMVTVALTVVTLAALAYFFRTYFDIERIQTADDIREIRQQSMEAHEQLPSLHEHRRTQREKLSGAPTTIDAAVAQLTKGGRRANPSVHPRRSDNLAAVEGWSEAKDERAIAQAQRAVDARLRRERAARDAAARAAEAARLQAELDAATAAELEAGE